MTSGAATTAAVAPERWRKERREMASGCSIGLSVTAGSLSKGVSGVRIQYVTRGGEVARSSTTEVSPNGGPREDITRMGRNYNSNCTSRGGAASEETL
jgi:hypothetical protein